MPHGSEVATEHMGPKASDEGFSLAFVQALQWLIWNQVWQTANVHVANRSTPGIVKDQKKKEAQENNSLVRKHLAVAEGSKELPECVIEQIRDLAKHAGEEAGRAHSKKEPVQVTALHGVEPPSEASLELWSRLLSAVSVAMVTVREGLSNPHSDNYKRLQDEYANAWHWLSSPRWHIRKLKDMGETGSALFACAPLYSHVHYFARLAQWLAGRGHKVRLVTVTSDLARKAAAQTKLPEGALVLLPENGMSSGFSDIWNELSLQGKVGATAEAKWEKSTKYLQTAATRVIANFKPDLVVSDGMYEHDFVECCKKHARRVAVLVCHARKDGVFDDHGPEPFPTLYPTVGALFSERHIFQTTVLCGPFLPVSLQKSSSLREGRDDLRAWIEADDRPLIYVSFGTVAALRQEFVARFARALLDFCRSPPLRVGVAADAQAGHAPELHEGEEVRIVGLTKSPQLNGQRGVLLKLDEASGRWTVKLESGEKAIKPDNLEFVGETWVQLQESWSDTDEFKDGGKCKGTPAELSKCRDRCRERGYGGFALSEGSVYYYLNSRTQELLEHADASPSSVLHFALPAARVPRESQQDPQEQEPPAPAPENPLKARWECPTCGEPNNSERQVCNSCGRARPSVQESPAAAEKKGATPDGEDGTAGSRRQPWCKVLWALPKQHQKLLPLQAQKSQPHFRVEEFVPQQAVLRLRRTALCISHCGANSTHESLACGVPMLCVPFFRDQYDWCRAVVRRGAGVPLDCRSCTEEAVREAVALALSPARAQGAKELSRSILEHLDGKTGLARAAHFCLLGMLNQG